MKKTLVLSIVGLGLVMCEGDIVWVLIPYIAAVLTLVDYIKWVL